MGNETSEGRVVAPNSKRNLRLLTRTTLLRKIYRVLLNTGRTYAAFTETERELLNSLGTKEEIFDPMSGYGSLTRYCAEVGIKSYCLEFNLPQHLWQVLCHPKHTKHYFDCCRLMISWKKRWPDIHVRGVASDEWFPAESKDALIELTALTQKCTNECFGPLNEVANNFLSAALLLPFVGRLSCSVPGDIVTHVKKGGICVYHGWQSDFELYLLALIQHLKAIENSAACTTHTLIYGDARTFLFPEKRFDAMITSPPYPNHRDFVSMFGPEHTFLDLLKMQGSVTSRRAAVDIIGTNFVSKRPVREPRTRAAKRFLAAINELKRNDTAVRHDNQYYIPYFKNYFADLEEAYKNIATALSDDVEAYITIVDNTHRNLLIPVSEVILEVWKSLGFQACIAASSESFHVGTKNPRARGLRARHTEHLLRITRH